MVKRKQCSLAKPSCLRQSEAQLVQPPWQRKGSLPARVLSFFLATRMSKHQQGGPAGA